MMMSRLAGSILAVVVSLSVSADHHGGKAKVAGKWHAVAEMPTGEESASTFTFEEKEGKLSAEFEGENGDVRTFDQVSVDGKVVTAEMNFDFNGQAGVIGMKATLGEKGALKGNWYAKDGDGNEQYSGAWSAVRALDPVVVGVWNVVAETDEGDNEHRLVLSKTAGKYSGNVESDGGSLPVNSVKVKKNKLDFGFDFGEGSIKVSGVLVGAKKLSGRWTYYDASEIEVGSGKWTAKK